MTLTLPQNTIPIIILMVILGIILEILFIFVRKYFLLHLTHKRITKGRDEALIALNEVQGKMNELILTKFLNYMTRHKHESYTRAQFERDYCPLAS